jgi:hypothetical protein
MAKEFSFTEDISRVLWKETAWHNALRAVGAGIVWSLLMLVTGSPGESLGMLVLLPFVYFVFLMPVGVIAAWLSAIPFVGLITRIVSLIIVVGDPLVYALSRYEPRWVPVDRPDFFAFRVVIFVMSPFDE